MGGALLRPGMTRIWRDLFCFPFLRSAGLLRHEHIIIAVSCEVVSPMRIEFAVADLPSAPVNANQHRRFAEALRQVEITEQTHAVVLAEHDVGSGRRLV